METAGNWGQEHELRVLLRLTTEAVRTLTEDYRAASRAGDWQTWEHLLKACARVQRRRAAILDQLYPDDQPPF